jgi:hypothetical protein
MTALIADLHEELRAFVDREVYYCVSQLISHLAKDTESEYYDEIVSICWLDDYESAAYEEGYRVEEDAHGCYIWFKPLEKEIEKSDREQSDESFDDELDAWRDCCEVNGIDPQQTEAYEYWLVSDWLAQKLAAKGSIVGHDIYGLTVWGRCTTGQAICMDGVIGEIYRELHQID